MILSVELTNEQYARYKAGFKKLQQLEEDAKALAHLNEQIHNIKLRL